MTLQTAPSHWTWTRLHNPRRCLLCWTERLAVRFGLAKFEED